MKNGSEDMTRRNIFNRLNAIVDEPEMPLWLMRHAAGSSPRNGGRRPIAMNGRHLALIKGIETPA